MQILEAKLRLSMHVKKNNTIPQPCMPLFYSVTLLRYQEYQESNIVFNHCHCRKTSSSLTQNNNHDCHMNERYSIFSYFNQLLCHFSKRKNLTYNNQRYAILVHLHRPYTEDLASFLYLFVYIDVDTLLKANPKMETLCEPF